MVAQSNCITDNEIGYEFHEVYIAYEVDNDILRFNSLEDFDKTVISLEKEYDTYNNYRNSQFPTHYTTAEMDLADSVDNFDEFFKLKEFETQFTGFNSRRSLIEATELEWLDNNMTGIDPDERDFIFDDAENTLYNELYQVKIGCDIYEMTENGLVNISNPEQKINNTNSTSRVFENDCYSNRTNHKLSYASQNQRLKVKAAIHSFFVRSSVKGKAVNYEYNGKWKKCRTTFSAACTGIIYDGTCTGNLTIGVSNPSIGFKKSRQAKAIYRWWELATHQRQTKNNKLAGSYELETGFTDFIFIYKQVK